MSDEVVTFDGDGMENNIRVVYDCLFEIVKWCKIFCVVWLLVFVIYILIVILGIWFVIGIVEWNVVDGVF